MNQKAKKVLKHVLKWLSLFLLTMVVIQVPLVMRVIASVPSQTDRSPNAPSARHDQDTPTAAFDLPLTNEGSNWLDDHPEITIAINQAWPPMDYVDVENGQGEFTAPVKPDQRCTGYFEDRGRGSGDLL